MFEIRPLIDRADFAVTTVTVDEWYLAAQIRARYSAHFQVLRRDPKVSCVFSTVATMTVTTR